MTMCPYSFLWSFCDHHLVLLPVDKQAPHIIRWGLQAVRSSGNGKLSFLYSNFVFVFLDLWSSLLHEIFSFSFMWSSLLWLLRKVMPLLRPVQIQPSLPLERLWNGKDFRDAPLVCEDDGPQQTHKMIPAVWSPIWYIWNPQAVRIQTWRAPWAQVFVTQREDCCQQLQEEGELVKKDV